MSRTADDFYNQMSGAFAGTENPENESTQATKDFGGTKEQQLVSYVNSTTISDAKYITEPDTQAAPIQSYLQATEYQAGHFKEYDSTPGHERIQERHRTGTGYEIDPNGTMKQRITADGYEIVHGSKYLSVAGECQISASGPIGISGNSIIVDASGDLSFNVGGNLNFDIGGSINMKSNTLTATLAGDMNVGANGFISLSATGDTNLEGASVSLAAKDADVNLVSSEDINIAAAENMGFQIGQNFSANAGEAVQLNAETSMSMNANDTMHMISKANMTMNSNADLAMTSTGKSTLNSSGGTEIRGQSLDLHSSSVIGTFPMVKNAENSTKALISAASGPVTMTPIPTGSDDAGASSATVTADKMESSKMAKAAQKFNPINTASSQSGGLGGVKFKGFKGGFSQG